MNKIAINPVLSLRHIRLPNFTCLFFLCVFFQFTGKIYALKNDILPGGRAAFLANHAPFFEVNNYHFNVFEDIVKGTSLGTLSASDPDNDQLKYVIVAGNTNGTLSIDSATGLLTLVKQLNHHTQDSFILRVSATDPKGLSAETKVIVAVEKAASKSGVDSLLWGRAANQQYPVNESQGEVVNGMLYTFGGFDSQKPSFTPTSRAYVFNPVANKWAPIAPMPPMNGTGYGGVTHAGFTTDGTDIYFAGGYTSNTAGNGQKFGTKEVWKYVVAKNIYMRLPDLPLVVAAGQLEYLEGKLHHIGGTNAARTVDLPNHYVLNLDSLSAGWKMLAPLPNPRQHSGSVVYEEKIYYIGGQHGQDDKLVAQKEVDRYDPVTNTWKKMADLPVPEGTMGRGHICSATIVLGEYIIVVAGETVHNSGRTNIVSAYMPALNTWQNLTPLPQTRYSGVAANLGGVIYYTGGSKTNITYMGQGVNTVQQVESLTVWNADTDQPIKTLLSGDTIDIGKLASNNLNIVANINPHIAGSVLFNLRGKQNKDTIENKAPYALFGDNDGTDYKPWTPSLGDYSLKITPYSLAGAKGIAGYSSTITFTVVNSSAQRVNLSPIADAFIRNGSYANDNYGGDSLLNIKSSHAAEFNRYAYVKFSLQGISDIASATLRLYCRNISKSGGVSLSCYGVNDDSWAENQIAFRNAPPNISTSLSTAIISDTLKYYDFNVTNFVQTQFTGDKIVSLLVKDPKNSEVNFAFNSRENGQYGPQLVIGKSNGLKSLDKIATGTINNILISSSEKSTNVLNVTESDYFTPKVYPNPVHNFFSLKFATGFKGRYALKINDPSGRVYHLGKSLLKPGITNTVAVDISKLSLKPGMYFLTIYTTQQNRVIKLMVE